MRKRVGARDVHAMSRAGSPHRAGEIAQPVRGKQRRALERRNKKRAGQMRLMVFHAMKLCCIFSGSMSNAAASASGIPVNFTSTFARSRANDGMRIA